MGVDFNLILFNPDELCKEVVNRASLSSVRNDAAFLSAMDKISSSDNPAWSSRVAFGVLKERYPSELKGIIGKLEREYNSMIREVRKSNPEFSRICWNSYRMTGSLLRSPTFESMFRTESDANFARFFSRQQAQALNFDENSSVFEYWNGFDTNGYDRDFLFGVGKYNFEDKRGHTVESIWDFKQERLPMFFYVNGLS